MYGFIVHSITRIRTAYKWCRVLERLKNFFLIIGIVIPECLSDLSFFLSLVVAIFGFGFAYLLGRLKYEIYNEHEEAINAYQRIMEHLAKEKKTKEKRSAN